MRSALLLPALLFGSADALAQPLDAAATAAGESATAAPSATPPAGASADAPTAPPETAVTTNGEPSSPPATSTAPATTSTTPVSPPSTAPQATLLPLGTSSAATGPTAASHDRVESGDSDDGAGFRLEENPGWSGSLSANGQLLAMFGTDARGAYSATGGTLRLRYKYYTLGGSYELTDSGRGGGDFVEFGGLAGLFLPFRNWLDFEIAARLGQRTYQNSDQRFGPSGYQHATPVLGLSAMVTDRSNTGLLGGRIGGGMRASYDLNQTDLAWTEISRDAEGQQVEVGSGVDHIGGLSFGLFLDVGLDVSDSSM